MQSAWVLWGIYTGKFSPTEAAGVTVGFCVIVGVLSLPLSKIMRVSGPDVPMASRTYKDMVVVEGFKITEIPEITLRSAQITGILAPLIAVSVVMQQILSQLGAQQVIGDFVRGMGGYYAVLFTAMAIVFVAGMVLESLPNTIILAPILAPIAHSIGVDPIHFAVLFLVGGSIGIHHAALWAEPLCCEQRDRCSLFPVIALYGALSDRSVERVDCRGAGTGTFDGAASQRWRVITD